MPTLQPRSALGPASSTSGSPQASSQRRGFFLRGICQRRICQRSVHQSGVRQSSVQQFSRILRSALALGVLLSLMLAWTTSAFADERILNYDVHVRIADDGELHVHERIHARADWNEIRHGIFRDFPVLFQDDDGVHRVGFKLKEALRDGRREQVETYREQNFIRIRMGDPEVRLDRGEYVWEIRYRTDRQLRFFDAHDELNWNATGTEWLFPIDAVRVTIELPDGAKVTETNFYTGAFGSTDQNARLVSHEGQILVFESTEPLGKRQGLTVIVELEKGSIAAPSGAQGRAWWLRDNKGMLLVLAGLLFALLMYAFGRLRYGGDPPEGVIVPGWEVPSGASALRVATLHRRRIPLDVELLSLSLVELASQGIVQFQTEGDKTMLIPQAAEPRPLPPELRELAEALDERLEPFEIDEDEAPWFEERRDAMKKPLEVWLDSTKIFVRHNWVALVSVLVSATLFGFGVFTEPEEAAIVVLVSLASIGSLFVWTPDSLRGMRIQGGIAVWMPMVIHVLIAVSVAFAGLAFRESGGHSMLIPLVGVALLILHRLFIPTRRIATKHGRTLLDEVEGLRRYIALAEADRMNLPGRPEMSVLHYERLLPYAMALGLEEPWTKQFKQWMHKVGFQPSTGLAAHVTMGSYGRRGFLGGGVGGVNFQQSLSKSLTASLPIVTAAAASSSFGGGGGGGGGFSGGGGGGGGGGGW